jgi:hypothetical protein
MAPKEEGSSVVLFTRGDTQPESFSSDDDNNEIDYHPIVYTDEELEAMRQVRTKLLEECGIEAEARVGLKFLAVATINCKLRVDETCQKIKKFLDSMEPLGVTEIDDDLWKPEAAHELAPYAPCGKDYDGAATIWITGGRKVPHEEEQHHVQACIMHFLAVHADAISLRQGITFVIDVTQSAPPPKIGNEKAIQAFYQAFPQRPQAILIAGTNAITRTIVNASIKVASLFTKQKVLDRLRFVTVEQAKQKVPLSSAPKYVGGLGGGIDRIEEWVQQRLENLPRPEL